MRRAQSVTSVVAVAVLLGGCAVLTPSPPVPPPSADAVVVTPAPVLEPVPTPTPSPTLEGWADTLSGIASGVVSLSVGTCDPEVSVTGSGSLVAPDLILTAAHVVEDAAYVTALSGDQVVSADVVAYDPRTELALVRPASPLLGAVLALAEEDPPAGTPVAAVGYPLGGALTISEGIVSALLEDQELGGYTMTDVVLSSVAANPGNSGGPLITRDGTQVGVVSSGDLIDPSTRAEGRVNSISATVAREMVRGHLEEAPSMLAGCGFDGNAPPGYAVEVWLTSDDPRARQLAQVLVQHGQGINVGDYAGAFALFSAPMQERMRGVEVWQEGLATSYWRTLTVEEVAGTDDAPTLRTGLRTEQAAADGYDGQTCSEWDLTYTFTLDDAEDRGWLVDSVDGDEPVPC